MNTQTIEIVKLTATEGMWLTDGTTFGRVIYLAPSDSVANWQEVTDEQKTAMEAEQQTLAQE